MIINPCLEDFPAYRSYVFKLARKLTGRHDLADDLANDACLALWEA